MASFLGAHGDRRSNGGSGGKFDLAVEVAETIDFPSARLQALADIMAAKQKAGKGEAGKE